MAQKWPKIGPKWPKMAQKWPALFPQFFWLERWFRKLFRMYGLKGVKLSPGGLGWKQDNCEKEVCETHGKDKWGGDLMELIDDYHLKIRFWPAHVPCGREEGWLRGLHWRCSQGRRRRQQQKPKWCWGGGREGVNLETWDQSDEETCFNQQKDQDKGNDI